MIRTFFSFARFGLTLQVFKTALAASASWLAASALFQNHYPYFAPLAAVLTVQVTVADSFEKPSTGSPASFSA